MLIFASKLVDMLFYSIKENFSTNCIIIGPTAPRGHAYISSSTGGIRIYPVAPRGSRPQAPGGSLLPLGAHPRDLLPNNAYWGSGSFYRH